MGPVMANAVRRLSVKDRRIWRRGFGVSAKIEVFDLRDSQKMCQQKVVKTLEDDQRFGCFS